MIMEKYYYLHNGKLYYTYKEMPNDESMFYKRKDDTQNWGDFLLKQWKDSLQPCEINDSELVYIKDFVYHFFEIQKPPIDITDIVEEKDGKIYFKQPKQVESECEAVEFLKWVWLNKYTDNNDADELYEIFKKR